MKKNFVKIGIATCIALFVCLLTCCKKNNNGSNYPDITRVNRLLAGNWEVTTHIEEDGSSYNDNGIFWQIELINEEITDYEGGYITMVEDGHSGSRLRFYLEPVFEGDLNNKNSSKEIGVYIYGQLEHDYFIRSISEKSMELREFENISDLNNMNECRGRIFTRR